MQKFFLCKTFIFCINVRNLYVNFFILAAVKQIPLKMGNSGIFAGVFLCIKHLSFLCHNYSNFTRIK